MTDIRFYHLQTQTLDEALPAILTKAVATGKKIVVRFPNMAAAHHYDEHLWRYTPDSFLPHGAKGDGQEGQQPIYLTDGIENPNGAQILVLCQIQTVPENIAEFSLCCDFVDGRDPMDVDAGRARWKVYKEAGHSLTYWQQTESGGWEQKA